jgi:hypothetical protein
MFVEFEENHGLKLVTSVIHVKPSLRLSFWHIAGAEKAKPVADFVY